MEDPPSNSDLAVARIASGQGRRGLDSGVDSGVKISAISNLKAHMEVQKAASWKTIFLDITELLAIQRGTIIESSLTSSTERLTCKIM